MILKVFAVYDQKAKAHLQPLFQQTAGLAIRMWENTVNDESTIFSKHPSDFTLMELGEYDDSTGNFTNHKTPLSLGTALHFKKQPQTQAPLFQNINKSN